MQIEVGGRISKWNHNEIRYKIKLYEIVRSRHIRRIPDFRKADFEGVKRYLQVAEKQQTGREIRQGS